MPESQELPEVGDYIAVTFEGKHSRQSPIKGRVTDVDTDPTGGSELDIAIDNGENSRTIHYTEGVFEGEPFATVTRYSEFSGGHHLGENAEWRFLE